MKPWTLFGTLVAAVLSGTPVWPADPYPDIDPALKDKASEILKLARERGCKNLAVLKFRARIADGPWSDNVGELNMNLARRLTVALLLALPDDSIGVIANANEVLAADGRANHLDEEGRLLCFKADGFQLAWGDPKRAAQPDLFVTGTAELSKDRKLTTVRIQAFGPDAKLIDLPAFTATTSARTLIDSGHGYVLPSELYAKGAKKSDLYKAPTEFITSPTAEKPPIELSIIYGTQRVTVQNGEAPEPAENVKVAFELKNTTPDTYGVVLKVNGENTLFREREPDIDCHKWIIEPGQTVKVEGFQTTFSNLVAFKVQRPAESRADEVRYGEHAGTFHVTAFRARGKDDPPPEAIKEKEDQIVKVIAKGLLKLEGKQAESLKVLQASLRQREQEARGAKGMIVSDSTNARQHEVKKIAFEPNPPIPVMSLPIRYYKPRNGK